MDVFPFREREIVLRADFGAVEDGDVVSVPLSEDGPLRPPHRGEFAYLLDGAGNGCVALCAKVRDGIARVMLVLETWSGHDAPPRSRRRDDG
ncbi:MAG: hypothetical protein QOJ12_628, partial [Thermoleophilales bacterium]|nr:hypothetical protein [Thermoleophilales bacterium]